jgi:hypothetical protein
VTGAGRAFSNQLLAAEQTVTRLELEYVMAMVPARWSPAAIIEAMERPVPEVASDKGSGPAGHSGARVSGSEKSAQA